MYLLVPLSLLTNSSPSQKMGSPLRNLLQKVPRTRFASTLLPTFPAGFTFWPRFLSTREQSLLLAAALSKLDSLETRHWRQKRKAFFALHPVLQDNDEPGTLF